MGQKSYLMVIVLSAVTSVTVSLLVALPISRSKSAAEDEVLSEPSGQGAEEKGAGAEEPGGSESAPPPSGSAEAKDPKALRQEIQDLKDRVGKLQSHIKKLRIAGGAAAPQNDTDKALEAFRKLLAAPIKNSGMVASTISLLMQGGDGVVDEIAEYLAKNEYVDLGGGMSLSGTDMRSYPNLSTALLYSLYSIGTDKARSACFDVMTGATSFKCIRSMLGYLAWTSVDDKWKNAASRAVLQGVRLLSEVPPEEVKKERHFGAHVMGISTLIDKLAVKEAAPLLTKTLEGGALDESGERSLINALVSSSPSDAAKMISNRLKNPKHNRRMLVMSVGGYGQARLPAQIEILRTLLAQGDLTDKDKGFAYHSFQNVPRMYGSHPRRKPEEIKQHLKVFLSFLRDLEGMETDEGLLKAIRKGIEAAEKKLGK